MFQAGVTAAGQLNGIRVAYYEDLGSSENDSVGAFMPGYADSGRIQHYLGPLLQSISYFLV